MPSYPFYIEVEYLKNPIDVKWFITSRCNLRCKFCYLEDYVGHDLSFDEVSNILKIIKEKEIVQVSLLGGEPAESKYFDCILNKLEKSKIYYSFSTDGQNFLRERKRQIF
ncbi:radical SAM protein [Lactovum miscens]|uniref:radical SAM protein n=1 Tax=Lactovum miscens TaxID=190387 RepID=UPI00161D457A